MSASSAYASHQFQDFLGDFYSRRLLLHNPLYPPPAMTSKSSSSSSYSRAGHYLGARGISLDATVVMVLSVLLCALICSLGLNSIIRCALRCSSFVAWWESFSSSSVNNSSARSANTGVKKKALKTFPIVTYSAELNLPGLDSECVICLSDLTPGERVRLLPSCNHGFHVKCIDTWLSSHSSCPKCRQSLIETCKKIVAANSSSSETINSHYPPPAVGEHETIVVSIATLEHEGYLRES